jgi:acylphosphatase
VSSDIQQLHAIVRGRVQGVNFRASTVTQASRLGLLGWVRNQPDGSVEVLAEGPRPALEQLVAYLRRGPQGARVSAVEPVWQTATQTFRQFEVRW